MMRRWSAPVRLLLAALLCAFQADAVALFDVSTYVDSGTPNQYSFELLDHRGAAVGPATVLFSSASSGVTTNKQVAIADEDAARVVGVRLWVEGDVDDAWAFSNPKLMRDGLNLPLRELVELSDGTRMNGDDQWHAGGAGDNQFSSVELYTVDSGILTSAYGVSVAVAQTSGPLETPSNVLFFSLVGADGNATRPVANWYFSTLPNTEFTLSFVAKDVGSVDTFDRLHVYSTSALDIQLAYAIVHDSGSLDAGVAELRTAKLVNAATISVGSHGPASPLAFRVTPPDTPSDIYVRVETPDDHSDDGFDVEFLLADNATSPLHRLFNAPSGAVLHGVVPHHGIALADVRALRFQVRATDGLSIVSVRVEASGLVVPFRVQLLPRTWEKLSLRLDGNGQYPARLAAPCANGCGVTSAELPTLASAQLVRFFSIAIRICFNQPHSFAEHDVAFSLAGSKRASLPFTTARTFQAGTLQTISVAVIDIGDFVRMDVVSRVVNQVLWKDISVWDLQTNRLVGGAVNPERCGQPKPAAEGPVVTWLAPEGVAESEISVLGVGVQDSVLAFETSRDLRINGVDIAQKLLELEARLAAVEQD